MKTRILGSILLTILLLNTLPITGLSQQTIRFGKTKSQTQVSNPPPLTQAGTPKSQTQGVAPQSFIGDIVDGIVKIGEDIIEAGASLFEGRKFLTGIALVGSQLIIPIPGLQGKAIPVFIVGATAGKALIKQRHMTPQERAFAEKVFGNSLPPNDKIFLTNLTGIGGREFTIPNGAG